MMSRICNTNVVGAHAHRHSDGKIKMVLQHQPLSPANEEPSSFIPRGEELTSVSDK